MFAPGTPWMLLTILVSCAALGGVVRAAEREGPAPTAVVFSDSLPGFNEALAKEIAAQVRSAGYTVEFINLTALTNQAVLKTASYDLLVLAGAGCLPLASIPAIESYLTSGGDLLALGLPAWEDPPFQLHGQWITRKGFEERLVRERPSRFIEQFEAFDLSRWAQSGGTPESRARYEVVDTSGGKALHATIDHLGGWNTLLAPGSGQPFAPGHGLTCFRAKGGPDTRQLALEWQEKDSSRWIATVNLTSDWKWYVLPPEAFKTWESPGRGAPGDCFHPENAARWSVGLALTHTALQGERHEYWFGNFGTAVNPFGHDQLPEQTAVPRFESLSPGYQFFPITTPVVVRSSHERVACDPNHLQGLKNASFRIDAGAALLGLHPRPRGIGFDQRRPFRWEPLLAAYEPAAGDGFRGTVAALLVNMEKYPGSVWGLFTPAEASFYCQPLVRKSLQSLLQRMARGVFLIEGGSEFFTVFPGQKFKVGARAANFGRATQNQLSVSIRSDGRKPVDGSWEFALAPGGSKTVEQEFASGVESGGGIRVILSSGGKAVDALSHELGVMKPDSKPKFIKARDGGFYLGGKSWKAHGVNYMPSTGIGVTSTRFFEFWISRGSYDPEVIQRDLRRIKGMGLNAVSVFIYRESMDSQNLLDLLRRCHEIGLHVNLSLRPGTPMNFRWQEMKELIEFHRLRENDAVFAYDLAWEPSHGSEADQQRDYREAWNEWVIQNHGSVQRAEQAWGVPAPKGTNDATHLRVPPMSQLTQDGPWRKLAAEYRLFLDDQLRQHYSEARRLVHSIDPNHAVSFRMSCTGDPTFNWDRALAYDFLGLAKAIDIWEPEAYGRIGDWNRVKAGEFTAAYARLCDASKPLVWAEMGYSVWDMSRMEPHAERMQFEAAYYRDFYRMMIESGADGVFFWWYPGGFRCGENSDFGILNADGTDRAVTKVIRSEGRRFLDAPKPAAPRTWIYVDRDADARGLFGMYETAKDRFWKTGRDGERPGLKWETKPGSGTR
jgi:hypothetical protein